MDLCLIVACTVVAAAVVQSALMLLQTWEHRRYARSCMHSRDRFQAVGRALIVAPCKGVDVGQLDNLRAILRQDYADYEVAFVVETPHDPACAAIRQVIDEHPHIAARLVVAGQAIDSGQKVHNLCAATSVLDGKIEYVAFVDSDARPRPEWLRLLIARLDGCQYGAATGYRWFVPAQPTWANLLLYSINCSVMMLLGKRSHYLVWGGSWAMRRDKFDAIGLHAAWRGTLSDDLMATRVLRDARLPTRFEPVAVVASPLDMSFGRVLEFVRRQYVVARFYTPRWWWFALVVTALPNLAWASVAALAAAGLTSGWPPLWLPVSMAATLYGLGVLRGAIRQSLVATYFPERAAAMRAARCFDIFCGPLAALVHWAGMLASAAGRTIVWRGLRYRLFVGGAIHIEGRSSNAQRPVEPRKAA